MKKPSVRPAAVVLAPTIAMARRAAGRRPEILFASPGRPAALGRALKLGLPVIVEPAGRNDQFLRYVRRKYLLRPAPPLLKQAISGIGRHHEDLSEPSVQRPGPSRAHWIEGDLTDARARRLLAEKDVPRVWIVEDFPRVRISARTHKALEGRRIRLYAFRALHIQETF